MNNFEKLYQFHGKRRSNQLLNISLKNKYIWFKNPKVASSTLSKSLQLLEVEEVSFLKTPPHPGIEGSTHVKPYQIAEEDRLKLVEGGDFFRFTFVRNPYIRLVSAYQDKVANNKAEKIIVLNMMGMPDADPETTEISFEEFVQVASEHAPERQDQHWMPQVYTTCAYWTNHDFVGKMETFGEDFDKLSSLLKGNLKDHYQYHAPHRSNAKESYKDYYRSDDIRAKVIDMYGEDFERFGYSTDLT